MKILVTGGSGFIAKHYIDKIECQGFNTVNFDLPEHDIRDTIQVDEAVKNCDIIIHFAAVADLGESKRDVIQNHYVNVDGTFNIARACQEFKKKLIFISTCCVYGNSYDMPETELKTAPMANEPYACSKVAGEYIIRGMPYLNWCILRIGTVYGVGMREALFTYICLDAIKNGRKIYIDGNGEQTRQLIYIDDLIDGICIATNRFYDDKIPNEIINLCGAYKISALETMKIAQKIVKKEPDFEHREQRYGQTFNENISIKKSNMLLDWEPKTSFYDGMHYTYNNDPRFK